MIRICAVLFLFSSVLQLSAANRTEFRETGSFSRLDVSCSGNMTLIQGEREGIEITGSPSTIRTVKIAVRNGTVYVSRRSSFLFGRGRLAYTVYVRDIQRVTLNGSGTLYFEKIQSEQLGFRINGSGSVRGGMVNAGWFGIQINGSGEVEITRLAADVIDTEISGSGDLTLSGLARSGRVKISGSGKYMCKNLALEQCDILISGSGDALVNVSGPLRIKVSGSGKVLYTGSPDLNILDVSGSGDVSPINHDMQ